MQTRQNGAEHVPIMFFLILLVAVLVITYWPGLSLTLGRG